MNNEITKIVSDICAILVKDKINIFRFLTYYLCLHFNNDRFESWDVLMQIYPIYEINNIKELETEENLLLIHNTKNYIDRYVGESNIKEVTSLINKIDILINTYSKDFGRRKILANILSNVVNMLNFTEKEMKTTLTYMMYVMNREKYMEV
ncbi:MAG: hypothetical protein FWF46_05100 [Oscillospiraceae bacterium]|nr:hypothetical protein [Oscillospiraceae bacterium]